MRFFSWGVVSAGLAVAALGFAGTAMTSTPAVAACKAPLSFDGPPRPTVGLAQFNAIERWQWDAEKTHKRRFSDWRHAKNSKLDCSFILIGFVCTATGNPCDR